MGRDEVIGTDLEDVNIALEKNTKTNETVTSRTDLFNPSTTPISGNLPQSSRLLSPRESLAN